jgi:hypothetical protein
MTRIRRLGALKLAFSVAFSQALGATGFVQAQQPGPRAARPVIVRNGRPCSEPTRTATLGTFQPTPVLTIRGNFPLGGGYSPLDIFGDQTLAIYGPLSPLRATTAPVRIYVRGYDGSVRVGEAASFSNPNLPELSPVRYPTGANDYFGPRVTRLAPWGPSAINWIDQN